MSNRRNDEYGGSLENRLRYKTLKERTKQGSEKVKEVEKKQKNIQLQIKDFTEKSDILKPQKLDSNLLVNVGTWFSENKKLKENLDIQNKKIEELQIKVRDISNEIKPFQINTETFNEDFKTKNEALEILKKDLSEKRTQLEVQQKLAHFSNDLHDGESCPLCGALEHPNIVVFEDVESELHFILRKIEKTENEQKENQKLLTEIEKILYRKNTFEEQLKAEGVDYKAGSFPFKALGRARAGGDLDGFVKILADAKTDEVLGVHMIGARCADLIAEAVVAMEFRASAEDISRMSHAHPTFAEAIKEAALAATDNRALHV